MSNQRERLLMLVLLGVIFLGVGGIGGYQFLYRPIQERQTRLTSLQEALRDQKKEIERIQQRLPELVAESKRSLPANVNRAQREYEIELNKLFRSSGFDETSISIGTRPAESTNVPTLMQRGKKVPIFQRLTFTNKARGKLDNLVRFMEGFYGMNLLHQIKSITVQRLATSRQDELQVNMQIEALILDTAPDRKELLPSEEVPPLKRLAANRDYIALTSKDVFFGPPPPPPVEEKPPEFDFTPYVRLSAITFDEVRTPEENSALHILAGAGMRIAPNYQTAIAKLWDYAQNYDYELRLSGDGSGRVWSYFYLNKQRKRLSGGRRGSRYLSFGEEGSELHRMFRLVRFGNDEIVLQELDTLGTLRDGLGLLAGGSPEDCLPKVIRWPIGEVLANVRPVRGQEAWLLLSLPPGLPLPEPQALSSRRGR